MLLLYVHLVCVCAFWPAVCNLACLPSAEIFRPDSVGESQTQKQPSKQLLFFLSLNIFTFCFNWLIVCR